MSVGEKERKFPARTADPPSSHLSRTGGPMSTMRSEERKKIRERSKLIQKHLAMETTSATLLSCNKEAISGGG